MRKLIDIPEEIVKTKPESLPGTSGVVKLDTLAQYNSDSDDDDIFFDKSRYFFVESSQL